jgi:hypothetical protein
MLLNSSSKSVDSSIKDNLLITNREERKLLDESRWRSRNGLEPKNALRVIYDNTSESKNSLDETLPLFKDLLPAHFELSEAACSFLVPFSRFPFSFFMLIMHSLLETSCSLIV